MTPPCYPMLQEALRVATENIGHEVETAEQTERVAVLFRQVADELDAAAKQQRDAIADHQKKVGER